MISDQCKEVAALRAFAIHMLSKPWAQREYCLTDADVEATGDWDLKYSEGDGLTAFWIVKEKANEPTP